MSNIYSQIPEEMVPEVFKVAAQLYAEKNQEYSLSELMQAGIEANIPPEFIKQALVQLQAQKEQIRSEKPDKKIRFGSLLIGIATSGLFLVTILQGTFSFFAARMAVFRMAEKKTDFSRANFEGANLVGRDLSHTNLSRANLKGADLSGANLSGANLSRANLSNANLSNADLSNANLKRAVLDGVNLDSAKLDGIFNEPPNRLAKRQR